MISLARPFLDEREKAAVGRVMDSGWIMQGPEVARFEEKIAGYCGVEHCIAVSSGTAALHICFLSLRIGKGDTVAIPSFAWPSAANVSMLTGAKPLFIDSEPTTYNLDCDDLAEKVVQATARGERPAMVVPVHQFGVPCDMTHVLSLAETHGMIVLEDAACALGSMTEGRFAGTLGRAGVFSFHPRKVLTTGEGGAVITNDDRLARSCRAYRNHGDHERAGLNYRMTDIQAAIGIVQMDKLPEIRQARARLLSAYVELLKDQDGIVLPDYLLGGRSSVHQSILQTLMIILDSTLDRRQVIEHMAAQGVEAKPGSVATHLLPVHRLTANRYGESCPTASTLHHCGLALPLHPAMTVAEVEYCVRALRRAIADGRPVSARTLQFATGV